MGGGLLHYCPLAWNLGDTSPCVYATVYDVMFYASGTEKQHVADDYAKRLAAGVAECEVGWSDTHL